MPAFLIRSRKGNVLPVLSRLYYIGNAPAVQPFRADNRVAFVLFFAYTDSESKTAADLKMKEVITWQSIVLY